MYIQPDSRQRGLIRALSGTTVFYALLCFSLAGLLTGFAVGGFAAQLSRKSPVHPSLLISSVPTAAKNRPRALATTLLENVSISVPTITKWDYVGQERADGTTSYQLSVQIVNKRDRMPVTSSDVLCRLWLTDDIQATNAALSADNYTLLKNPALFDQPFPQEVVGALNFASASQQTQPCAANGKTMWTYTLAPSVLSGAYYLAVLADWKGVSYSWYMVGIKITDEGKRGD
jgi:hypothetical protein